MCIHDKDSTNYTTCVIAIRVNMTYVYELISVAQVKQLSMKEITMLTSPCPSGGLDNSMQ